MSQRDERLRQFFGCYFNQDWRVGGARSWTDVAAQYVKENPRAAVSRTIDDLRAIASDMSSAVGLAALECDYNPLSDGLTDREWVRQLADVIERQLTN